MAVHGDIREVTFNHPTIGSGILEPKSGESNTFDLGGFRTSDDANAITTSGQNIRSVQAQRGFMELVVEDDENGRQDMERMTQIAASDEDAEFTVTMRSGSVYGAKGFVVGDLQKDTLNGTFTVKIVPQGKWKKIA